MCTVDFSLAQPFDSFLFPFSFPPFFFLSRAWVLVGERKRMVRKSRNGPVPLLPPLPLFFFFFFFPPHRGLFIPTVIITDHLLAGPAAYLPQNPPSPLLFPPPLLSAGLSAADGAIGNRRQHSLSLIGWFSFPLFPLSITVQMWSMLYGCLFRSPR